ncbi:hypothetical protein Leryth_021200, partial [Lithospermum erythrorhizon]
MRALVSNIKAMAANSAADHLPNLAIEEKANFTLDAGALDNHLKATIFLESMEVPYIPSRYDLPLCFHKLFVLMFGSLVPA